MLHSLGLMDIFSIGICPDVHSQSITLGLPGEIRMLPVPSAPDAEWYSLKRRPSSIYSK